MKTVLIVGLGNPGKKYARTRHNAGFMFVDYFFEKFLNDFGFSDWEFSKKLNAQISLGKIKDIKDKKLQLNFLAYARKLSQFFSGDKIILLKPQTFMNLSGEAVKKALRFYKLKPEGLFIIHDDIDLSLGKYKISVNSSSAGHNGVQNIIDRLGTKKFARLRIGIDNRRDMKIATEKYVLGKFTNAELKKISEVNKEISGKLVLSSRA